MRAMMPEVLVILTHPIGSLLAEIFTDRTADGVVFCCYCREAAHRGKLLRDLRTAAGQPPVPAEERDERTRLLAQECVIQHQLGNHAVALAAAIRWRAIVQGRGYHTYTLRQGQAPYPWGVVVAFSELDAERLEANVERAEAIVQAERDKVMDVFGWGVQQ